MACTCGGTHGVTVGLVDRGVVMQLGSGESGSVWELPWREAVQGEALAVLGQASAVTQGESPAVFHRVWLEANATARQIAFRGIGPP